ncbi:unnamed protein product [Withania somnifera]
MNQTSVSFFNFLKPETASSRWNRISSNASKVGKGLSKDAKAQKLAFQHWIEAIDPHHRYGHNLHIYYGEWSKTDSGQPFFFWLDLGDGKKFNLEECPRSKLQKRSIKYLGPQEREHYKYIVAEGKIVHEKTGNLLDTTKGLPGAKWIYLMSTSRRLYAGEMRMFHHSSFLAGGATLAAGRLVVKDGRVMVYQGHYHPTEDRLDSFLSFLIENAVNLDELSYKRSLSGSLQIPITEVPKTPIQRRIHSEKSTKSYELSLVLSTGAGPRIGCVADFPAELRWQALELTNLSPRPCSL